MLGLDKGRADLMLVVVLNYCYRNYENGWCDLVVETTTNDELREIIGDARTERAAILRVRKHFKDYADYRSEIQATADW